MGVISRRTKALLSIYFTNLCADEGNSFCSEELTELKSFFLKCFEDMEAEAAFFKALEANTFEAGQFLTAEGITFIRA